MPVLADIRLLRLRIRIAESEKVRRQRRIRDQRRINVIGLPLRHHAEGVPAAPLPFLRPVPHIFDDDDGEIEHARVAGVRALKAGERGERLLLAPRRGRLGRLVVGKVVVVAAGDVGAQRGVDHVQGVEVVLAAGAGEAGVLVEADGAFAEVAGGDESACACMRRGALGEKQREDDDVQVGHYVVFSLVDVAGCRRLVVGVRFAVPG